jgi:peptidyl-tRNA hydrolase
MTNENGRFPESAGGGVQVSDAAMDVLSRALDSSREKAEELLRLSRQENRLELNVAVEEAGDNVIQWEERPVLAISPEAQELLDGFVLDAETTDEGMALVLKETPGRF